MIPRVLLIRVAGHGGCARRTACVAALTAVATALLLPADARVLRDEFRTNVRVLLETSLARMDLVTREEFEAQTAMLRRTREKLETLEARLAEMEKAGY